jgi:hypothetical protein
MPHTLDVTVPCAACSAPVGFPGRVCPSCSAVVPFASRKALEQRLEAADDDFREARTAVRSAATILLLIALLCVAVGLGRYLLEVSSDLASSSDRVGALAGLAANVAVGAVLFGCAFAAKRHPLPAVGMGFLVWLLAQVGALIASPISALPIGITGFVVAFLRLAILLLLVRGLLAAIRGQRLVRRMTDRP